TWLDDRISQWAKEVEVPFTRKINEVSENVDKILARLDALEAQQIKAKDNIPKLIEQRSSNLMAQINDCKILIEQEQNLREEREKSVHVKIQDVAHRLKEQM